MELTAMTKSFGGVADIFKGVNRSSIEVELTSRTCLEGCWHTQGNQQIKMGELTPKSMPTIVLSPEIPMPIRLTSMA
ncbi:hypothetical protein [Shewanella mangrovisoli]|uniref:hypothetical protein n=1 Tax=Shewanella mangrovisoli TaxID=2864211 RepID=UPI0035B7EC83